MENNCICCNALQKFYSALKNLNSFSVNNDIIDNISALDCFFSEFRNITFVLQKDFADNNLREKYEELCLKYLQNDDMKWFITKRNEISKKSPINLEKNMIIEIYLPNDRLTIEDNSLKINNEEAFNVTKNIIKEIITKKIGMVDLFFSIKIIFKENNEQQELMPKIIFGIETMIKFMREICLINDFHCDRCDNLFSKIEELYKQTVLDEVLFVYDYYLEKNEIKSADTDLQLYSIDNNKIIKNLKNIRTPMNEFLFGNSNDINEIFERFIVLHLGIFNMSHGQMSPAFMILYKDFTTQIFPIYAISKTTIYRNIYEIVDKINFEEILSVFYCGEIYEYSYDDFNTINKLEYSERIKKAPRTLLSFTNINNCGRIKQYLFDVEHIMCENYIINKLNEKNEFFDLDNNEIFFLKPIVKKLKEINK